MNALLTILAVLTMLVLGLIPWAVGIVLARRASNRWRWPEAQLIFRVHIAQLVLFVASAVTLPLIGWLMRDSFSLDLFNWFILLFRIAAAVPVILLAVGLYRLAKRASYSADAPGSTEQAEPSGTTDPVVQEG